MSRIGKKASSVVAALATSAATALVAWGCGGSGGGGGGLLINNAAPSAGPLEIGPARSWDAFQGENFAAQIPIMKGKPPYGGWQTCDGTSTPQGLSVNGNGVIAGRVSSNAPLASTIFVVCASDAGGTQVKTFFTITVNVGPRAQPGQLDKPNVLVGPSSSISCEPRGVFPIRFGVGGRSHPTDDPSKYTFSLGPGSNVPPGMGIAKDGMLTGNVPNVNGTFNPQIFVTDDTTGIKSDTLTFPITVTGAP